MSRKSENIIVSSPNVKYTDDYIFSEYEYNETLVTKTEKDIVVSETLMYLYKYCPPGLIDRGNL